MDQLGEGYGHMCILLQLWAELVAYLSDWVIVNSQVMSGFVRLGVVCYSERDPLL